MASTCVVLISLIGCLLAVDPGIVITVRETFFHQVTAEILPGLLQQYNSVQVPNQSQDDCSMTDIKASLQPIQSDTISISLVGSSNGIKAQFSEINSSTAINFSCTEFDVTISGSLTFDGPLSATAQIDISSASQGPVSLVPQVSSVSNFNIDADDSKFSVNFDCSDCTDAIREGISALLTDVVLPGMIDIIENRVPSELPSAVNPLLQSKFPVNFEIPNTSMSIQTGLTSTPTITDTALALSIDGTIFKTSTGYSRDGTLASLPGEDSSLQEGVQIQIADYVLQGALVQITTDQQVNLSYEIWGLTLKLDVDPEVNTGIQFTSGGLQLFAEPHFSVLNENANLVVGLKLGISLYLGFSASASSSQTDTTDITLHLQNIALDNIHVEFGSFSLNLSLLKYPLNALLWVVIKAIDEFGLKHVISVPKQSYQGFTIEAIDSHFHNGYVTAGVDVSYTPTS